MNAAAVVAASTLCWPNQAAANVAVIVPKPSESATSREETLNPGSSIWHAGKAPELQEMYQVPAAENVYMTLY